MMSKEKYFEFCVMFLQKIYKDDIVINNKNDIYEITRNGKKCVIETKYEMKKYMREIISSKNANLINDIINIMEIRYKLANSDIAKIEEIYPNIDIFISSYVKNEDDCIELKKFNYEELLEYFVIKAINKLDDKNLREEYEKLISSKEELKKEMIDLEERLKEYQTTQKNYFYYETYKDSLSKEMDNYNEEKIILENINKNYNFELNKLKKQYRSLETINQLSKKTNLKRINKISDKLNEIENLQAKIENNELELKKIEKNNKTNIERNNQVLKKYIDMSIDEYSNIYEHNKNVDGKEIVTRIKQIKNEIILLDDKLKMSEYHSCHRKLKYYCQDNLKILNKKTDLNPKLINNISKLLEDNIK